ncbi:transglutaminase-like cysteine peptidase [Pseudogulbenkiania sp. MAI-1]|uniref:transglutaminase-like cysteine peptidase n=1 Tax=Pseudogulbenkiania sp. MAI-1 TaxID=990370 RepID=UPI0004A37B30|nr:transglutaminase-like cysteine peptidase [Pseudogulbenkiania sp. MAI-1]
MTRCVRRVLAGLLLALLCLAVVGRSLPSQQAVARYGPQAQKLFREWQDLLNTLGTSPEAAQLKEVNAFFNRRIAYAEDKVVWKQEDYWPTPLETFSKGAGDCKSFVIGKYVSLRLLGVDPDKIRLTYVKARIGGPASNVTQAHMVLAYYPAPDVEPLVLDNLVTSILPASQRPDLIPVFSFNMESIWVGTTQNNNVSRLTRWKQLLDKMKAEGFIL